MSDGTQGFNIEELSERSGISVRTIRFYIAEGLVPRPVARGKGASYGEEHLSRLRLIRRLSEQRVPLAEIRDRMARLSLAEIRSLLQAEELHSAELQVAEQAPSAKEYVSALLTRLRQARSPSTPLREPPDMRAMAPLRTDDLADAAAMSPLNEADLPWRRLELAPGVELHVRADAEERSRRLIDRLLQQAKRG